MFFANNCKERVPLLWHSDKRERTSILQKFSEHRSRHVRDSYATIQAVIKNSINFPILQAMCSFLIIHIPTLRYTMSKSGSTYSTSPQDMKEYLIYAISGICTLPNYSSGPHYFRLRR